MTDASLIEVTQAVDLVQDDGSVLILIYAGSAGPPGNQFTLPELVSASPYLVAAQDCAKVKVWAGADALDVGVPNGLGSGFTCKFVLLGTGSIAAFPVGSAALYSPGYPAPILTDGTVLGALNGLATQYGTLELIPVSHDAYVIRGGDLSVNPSLDFSDPNNSGYLPGL